jgi:heat shock protein HspQ
MVFASARKNIQQYVERRRYVNSIAVEVRDSLLAYRGVLREMDGYYRATQDTDDPAAVAISKLKYNMLLADFDLCKKRAVSALERVTREEIKLPFWVMPLVRSLDKEIDQYKYLDGVGGEGNE